MLYARTSRSRRPLGDRARPVRHQGDRARSADRELSRPAHSDACKRTSASGASAPNTCSSSIALDHRRLAALESRPLRQSLLPAQYEPVARNGRVKLVALRPIKPGEEITFDYGEEYFALFFKKSGCRCADCRAKAARRRARARRALIFARPN